MSRSRAIRGLGIDAVRIARFEKTTTRAARRVDRRILSARERKAAARLRGRRLAEHLAGRFAAKEAILKALGTGLSGGIRWHDVEIVSVRRGTPRASLSGAALRQARKLKIQGWLLSISHTRDLALAVAIGQ